MGGGSSSNPDYPNYDYNYENKDEEEDDTGGAAADTTNEDYGQYYDYDYEAKGDKEYEYEEGEEEQEETEYTEEGEDKSSDDYNYEEEETEQNETNTDYSYEDEDDDYEEEEEEESSDYEEELLYRNYEILSDFYKKHFVDLRVLDTTCVPEETPPPTVENGYVKEYRWVKLGMVQKLKTNGSIKIYGYLYSFIFIYRKIPIPCRTLKHKRMNQSYVRVLAISLLYARLDLTVLTEEISYGVYPNQW